MGRWKTAPDGFACPYRDNCPPLEGLSAFWMFEERQRSKSREHEHWQIREQMAEENASLRGVASGQKQEIDRLEAENKLLHQRGQNPSPPGPMRRLTPRVARPCQRSAGEPPRAIRLGRESSPRIARHIHVEAPLICPHCQSATDATIGGQKPLTSRKASRSSPKLS